MNIFYPLILTLLISTYSFAQMPKKAELVSVNDTNLYYEVHGSGDPLIMLHGYSLSSRSWMPYVSDYANEYEVYLIDLTGHGRSDKFHNTLSIKSVANDLNQLLEYLDLKSVKAIGFSFGGDVLFQLALYHPYKLESMITIGAVGSWDVKDFPGYKKIFTYDNIDEVSWIRSYHSSEDQIKAVMGQFKNYTIKLSASDLNEIMTPVMIVLGDDDNGIVLEEVVRVRKNLPNSDLWILPNVAHPAHEGQNKAAFVKFSKDFFNRSETNP